jgi:predicted RNA-binding protein with PUA-like domain
MKSEPDDFSIEDLRKRPGKLEPWTGVRNYQARNYMRDDMKIGDPVLFYHSSVIPPGVAGLAEIASEPFPDPTAFDKKSKYYDPKAGTHGTTWMCVNVRHVETFGRVLTLDEMHRVPGLDSMLALKRGTRLSIQPVTPKEFKLLMDWIRKFPDEAPPAKAPSARPLASARGKIPAKADAKSEKKGA